jgi:hypothetical protein
VEQEPQRVAITVYEFRDGGRVEVTDPTIVPMGAAHTYRQLTYTNADGTFEIVFEVRDGLPGCVSIRMLSDENLFNAKSLAKIDNLRDEVFAVVGVLQQEPDGRWVHRHAYEYIPAVIAQALSPRKLTDEFLNRVAQVHNAAPIGKRTDAICAEFGVSPRTAWRYTAQAKKKGLIK